MQNPRYWLHKKAQRKTGYPVATIAYYGPDDTFASKVVVGIVRFEKEKDPVALRKWFAAGTDVRQDVAINTEILQFIDNHHVARIGMLERVIGCPHEEGIDYPVGEVCPQCPFWAGRDRWTGEKIH